MRLNHINLPVANVAATREFFEMYLGFKLIVEHDPKVLVVLSDGAQSILALNNFSHATEIVYPREFHIGFFQNSRDEVNAIHERLAAAGFLPEPAKEYHGAWTFYFMSPGGFTIEIAHQPGVTA